MQVNKEALEKLKSFSDDEMVFMLNYLNYREIVSDTGISGQETYYRYMEAAAPFFEQINAKLIFKGKPTAIILGPEEEALWDELLIVQYDNKHEFFKLMSMENYPFELRASALKDSRLILCK